jgi:tetratricopeptide (TPR) repeat protein
MSQDEWHVEAVQLAGLAGGEMGLEERRRVVRHLLSGCEACLALARRCFFPGEEADAAAVLRRLELAGVLAWNEVEVERRHGAEVWERVLRRLDAGGRLLAVRNDPRLRVWGVYERVLREAGLVLRSEPVEAADLAHLALAVADSLDPASYGEERIQDYRAAAWSAVGNAKRLAGDFPGAQAALEAAGTALARGTRDPLEMANSVSIRASLQADLGDLEGATKTLQRAVRLAQRVNARLLAGRFTLHQSSSIGWIDPARGLKLAEEGLRLLGQADDPHLELVGRHLLALWNHEIGEVGEARAILETYRYLYARQADVFWSGRRLDLEARIVRSEGDLAAAEAFFRELVELYAGAHFDFDLALATLDLAETLSLQGKWADAAELVGTLQPVLRQWKLHGDVLRSWAILRDGLERKMIDAGGFQALAITLRRLWFRR